jgi:hypothetical protein
MLRDTANAVLSMRVSLGLISWWATCDLADLMLRRSHLLVDGAVSK